MVPATWITGYGLLRRAEQVDAARGSGPARASSSCSGRALEDGPLHVAQPAQVAVWSPPESRHASPRPREVGPRLAGCDGSVAATVGFGPMDSRRPKPQRLTPDPRPAGARQADRRRARGRAGPQVWQEQGTYRFDRTQDPRADLLDRHPAADRQRLAARRARLLLHAHRHRRPLPADARQARSSTRWAGTTTACRPSAGCRTTSACACDPSLPYDPDFAPPAKPDAKKPGADLPAQLRRAVRAADRARTSRRSRRCGAGSGLSVDWSLTLHDHRPEPRAPPSQRGVPAQPGPRRGLPGRGADAVGRHVPDRGRAGRAGGPRAPRRLPPDRLPRPGSGAGLHRDHPAGAAPGLRGAGRAPGRRALPAAVRHDGAHAAVRRRGAGAGAPAGRAGQGLGHRDGLHVRRPDRRHLVARAATCRPGRSSAATAGCCRDARRGWRRAGRAAYAELAGKTVFTRPAADRRAAARVRRPATASRGRSRTRCKFYENGDKPLEIVTTRQWYIRNGGRDEELRDGAARARPASCTGCPTHMRHRYENWVERAQRRLADQPAAVLRRAVPGLVPAGRRRRARLRPAAAAGRGRRCRSTRRRDVPPGYTEDQRGQPGGFTGRPRRDGHLGHVVADAADRRAAGSATRTCSPGSSRWTCARRRTRSSAPGCSPPWSARTSSTARCRGRTPRSPAASLDPDRKKMSKSKGNVVDADRTCSSSYGAGRGALLGGQRPAGHGHRRSTRRR